jgi:Zn-dependent peptidase ImmA (M78 family)/DNA-binding XRE family transcriptional regulator
MSALEKLPAHLVGERLRQAREAADVTQAAAADAIGAARTTIVAIEKGDRRVRLGELQKLAQLYRTTVNALLRQESVHVDLVPRFRKLPGKGAESSRAAELMASLAKAEVELENLLGVNRPVSLPPERPRLNGDVRVQAEQDAAELRQRLGLGLAPIPNLVGVLEMDMGVRVYVRRLPPTISGLFAFDDAIGACILLNASHPRERRNTSAAHETGHLIATRRKPEVLHSGEDDNSREERYANAFARALLTPARAVMQKFADVTAGADKLTRKHVIVLANYFSVSREAMVRRLEELELTKRGTWDWFEANGGITDEQARQVLGDQLMQDEAKIDADRPTTLRLNLLSAEAVRRDLLSEGQLARLLQLDRVDLRALLDAYNAEADEVDDDVQRLR